MVVYAVTVFVKPEHVDEFIAATVRNHEGTRTEPGNRRFDVLQSEDDPTRFLLYEVYESAAAVAAHKETAHYQAWRDAVADWMAQPRQGLKHRALRPADAGAW